MAANVVGPIMGLRTVFTDHSLGSFNDAAMISLNKVIKWLMGQVDASITVSQAGKDNLTLRASIAPDSIFVIPNAVNTSEFKPNPELQRPTNTINIVVVSRLAFRKGVDLLVDVIPSVLLKHPDVRFIIGGDGPKRDILEEMRDNYNLHDKVELVGDILPTDVHKVLCRGHIFLNTSLTEAFCIAILEAVSCGLLCVSTNVAGIPEVLPPELVFLSPAEPKQIAEQVDIAINHYKKHGIDH